MENIFYGLKRWQLIFLSMVVALGLVSIIYSYRHRIPALPTSIRITIPEGFDNKDIANLFDIRFKYFDHQIFIENAPQGYMFPDTYYVGLYSTASTTIELLKSNFDRKIFPYTQEIINSKHSLKEIVIMASIIEAEVKGSADRRIVSGILWERIKTNMPLQVDSSPETYRHTGFPSSPLNNPGLDSISSAIKPTPSAYLYFLTDKNGIMHYAKTFDEHKANKAKYLQ